MAVVARQQFTFADYVRLEERSKVKHEFLDGLVWAMAGGSPEHAGIAATVVALLAERIRGKPCRAFTSDLRVRVVATGLGTYPDVTVVCGALIRDPADPTGHTVVNPRVIVEVLSPSTEDYDRGEKLGHYKLVESLQEVILVAHDRREIELVRREADGTWSRHIFTQGETAPISSLECDLAVSDVYLDPLADST
jgi:Uma2 family endonuclease